MTASNYCACCGKSMLGANTSVARGNIRESGVLKSNAMSSDAVASIMQKIKSKWIACVVGIAIIVAASTYYFFFSDKAVVTDQTKNLLSMMLEGKDLMLNERNPNPDIALIRERVGLTHADPISAQLPGLIFKRAMMVKEIKDRTGDKVEYSIGEVNIANATNAVVYATITRVSAEKVKTKTPEKTDVLKVYWVKRQKTWQLSMESNI